MVKKNNTYDASYKETKTRGFRYRLRNRHTISCFQGHSYWRDGTLCPDIMVFGHYAMFLRAQIAGFSLDWKLSSSRGHGLIQLNKGCVRTFTQSSCYPSVVRTSCEPVNIKQ